MSRVVTGSDMSRHKLDQSEVKSKPIRVAPSDFPALGVGCFSLALRIEQAAVRAKGVVRPLSTRGIWAHAPLGKFVF